MTRDEAKLILALYRPWANDANDPEFAAALALMAQDAELRRWFEQHSAAHAELHLRFKGITAPAGLKKLRLPVCGAI